MKQLTAKQQLKIAMRKNARLLAIVCSFTAATVLFATYFVADVGQHTAEVASVIAWLPLIGIIVGGLIAIFTVLLLDD